ncbi:hypothetical protein REPUB_Repub05bG0073400 [Reevesia pubescens]
MLAATAKNTKFQIISRITTGFEYAQSLWHSSSCSAAISRTSMEGLCIILRLLARRKNRATSRRLWLCTDRHVGNLSREMLLADERNGVVSMMSSKEDRFIGVVEAIFGNS